LETRLSVAGSTATCSTIAPLMPSDTSRPRLVIDPGPGSAVVVSAPSGASMESRLPNAVASTLCFSSFSVVFSEEVVVSDTLATAAGATEVFPASVLFREDTTMCNGAADEAGGADEADESDEAAAGVARAGDREVDGRSVRGRGGPLTGEPADAATAWGLGLDLGFPSVASPPRPSLKSLGLANAGTAVLAAADEVTASNGPLPPS
jgi:hypothetical protein